MGEVDLEGIRCMLRTAGVQPVAVRMEPGVHPTEDADAGAALSAAVLQCRRLGVPLLVLSPPAARRPDAEALASTARAFGRLADEAYGGGHGLRILVAAPRPGTLLPTPEHLADFVARADSPWLGVALESDTWASWADAADALGQPIGERVRYVRLTQQPGNGAGLRDLGAWLDRHHFRGNVALALERAGDEAIDATIARLPSLGWAPAEPVPAAAGV